MKDNPQGAGRRRFLLAYQYLMMGEHEPAIEQFERDGETGAAEISWRPELLAEKRPSPRPSPKGRGREGRGRTRTRRCRKDSSVSPQANPLPVGGEEKNTALRPVKPVPDVPLPTPEKVKATPASGGLRPHRRRGFVMTPEINTKTRRHEDALSDQLLFSSSSCLRLCASSCLLVFSFFKSFVARHTRRCLAASPKTLSLSAAPHPR